MLTSLILLLSVADPTSERPPVSYADREAHWNVDCRGELRSLAAGAPPDLDALRRCAHIHEAIDRPSCSDLLVAMIGDRVQPSARRVAAAIALAGRIGQPLDEGQCGTALGRLK